jgi:hypothetical protein
MPNFYRRILLIHFYEKATGSRSFFKRREMGRNPAEIDVPTIGVSDDGLLAFRPWHRGKTVWENNRTCTILATGANALLKDVQDRPPIML